MRRGRKLAIALLAVAVVLAAVYATGAFTSMTASRSVDVRVAGDGSAFLSLQPSSGPNGKYASYGPGGALQVTIGGAAGPSPATGVNPDSRTVFRNVFTITNRGSQPVSVWLTDENPAVSFIGPDGTSLEAKASAVTIRPGGRSLHVGLVIDARGVTPGANLLKSVTIHTDASSASVPAVARGGGQSASTGSGSSDRRWIPPISGGFASKPVGGSTRFYSLGSPVGLDGADTPTELFATTATSLPPLVSLVSFLTQSRDDTTCPVDGIPDNAYCPPHVPVDETPISRSASEDLKRILGVANRGEVHETVEYILTSPDAFGHTGGYRYIIGTYPGDQSEGKITLWVNGDTVVKAERGGQSTLTPPEGRSGPIHVVPDDDTHISLKDVPTPVLIALGVFPFDGGPSDEIAVSSILIKRYGPTLSKEAVAAALTIGGAIVGGGALLTDNAEDEQTKERETEGNQGQQETEETTQGDGSSDPDPPWRTLARLLDELAELLDGTDDPRPIPDGGTSRTLLEKSVSEANKWQGSKLDKPLTTDDVVRVGRDADGNITFLTNTDKWEQSEKQIPGWRHIVARHVHPNSTHYRKFVYTDGYPTKPAEEAGPDTTLFPKDMTPDEIQNLIMESARNGNVLQDNDPFTKVIIWSVPKTSKYYKKFGIKKMKVVIRQKSGMIKTAYPIKGGVKYKNT